jgi:hypothetical protein
MPALAALPGPRPARLKRQAPPALTEAQLALLTAQVRSPDPTRSPDFTTAEWLADRGLVVSREARRAHEAARLDGWWWGGAVDGVPFEHPHTKKRFRAAQTACMAHAHGLQQWRRALEALLASGVDGDFEAQAA